MTSMATQPAHALSYLDLSGHVDTHSNYLSDEETRFKEAAAFALSLCSEYMWIEMKHRGHECMQQKKKKTLKMVMSDLLFCECCQW